MAALFTNALCRIGWDMDQKTAWRTALDADWASMREKVDWKSLTQVHAHVARLMAGPTPADSGDWLARSRDRHLGPLLDLLIGQGIKRPGQGLKLVSLGCGQGNIERAILESNWPLEKMSCLEYDSALLEAARTRLADFEVETEFAFFDFNNTESLDIGRFDVIFFCHSIHHCTNVEGLMDFMKRSLEPHGFILGLDYFGPPRLLIEPHVRKLIDEMFGLLPENLRLNISQGGVVEDHFTTHTIEEIRRADPSEAPRSADLRSLLFASFPPVEILPMGGTILRPLLQHRAGNFRSDSDTTILNLLIMIERLLIETRMVQSDDLYFVCRHPGE
jgi:SAM-dependent methyltransferase